MKNLRKILSALIALVMVFTLATPVFAAEDDGNVITIVNDKEKHEYKAYQVFDANYEGDKLTNIEWGNGVDSDEFLADLKADEILGTRFDACTTAEQVADAMKDMTQPEIKAFAKAVYNNLTAAAGTSVKGSGVYTIAVEEDGYYFITETSGTLGAVHDAYTDYILEVVKDVTVNPKTVMPTVDKQVLDEELDAEENAVKGWGETADHDINEVFKFKLIANLPASSEYQDYSTYTKYTVRFQDQMTTNIDFVAIESVNIYVGDTTYVVNPNTEGKEDGYSYTPTDVNNHWSLTVHDVKGIIGDAINSGARIEVIYEAKLNATAGIGNTDENNNTVYLEYSNNPNVTTDFGKTNTDTVWVFTYEVIAKKIDGATAENETPTTLAGAQFKLRKSATEYVTVDANGKVTGWTTEDKASTFITGDDGLVKITGLDYGRYELVEIVAPTGYNLLKAPVIVNIDATHKEAASQLTATTIINESTSKMNFSVENKQGVELPSTGGIGTTLFYIFGGLLAVGAVVLLVTKKRVDA